MTAKRRLVTILFALLIVAAYFYGLGSFPLVGPDEPRYSQVAREMLERGDWITPTLGNANWFEKPALLYWLQITSYTIFGVSEFSARFGSAIFGLLTIFSLWILGSFLDAKSREESPLKTEDQKPKSAFAEWIALIAASTIGIIAFAHGASFDIILTFPITASLVCFYIYYHSLNENRSASTRLPISVSREIYAPLIGFFFFCGVGILAKGLVGIIFPYAIVATFLIFRRAKLPHYIFGSLIWGSFLALAVAAIWYVPMYLTYGWTFLDDFFLQHHFARFTSNKYLHPQPFWFFFAVLPLMIIPWTPFFIAALWQITRSLFVSDENPVDDENKSAIEDSTITAPGRLRVSASQLKLFALCWLAVPLIFFSFSGSKLPGYVLPSVPAAIILTADFIREFVSRSRARKNAIRSLSAATLITILALVHFVVGDFAKSESVKHLIEAASEKGFANARVLNLHTISHNAEFYAPKRLVRSEDGKLRKFYGVSQVIEEMNRDGGKPVLVIVPLEYLKEVSQSELIGSRVLADNGDLAIASVELSQK